MTSFSNIRGCCRLLTLSLISWLTTNWQNDCATWWNHQYRSQKFLIFCSCHLKFASSTHSITLHSIVFLWTENPPIQTSLCARRTIFMELIKPNWTDLLIYSLFRPSKVTCMVVLFTSIAGTFAWESHFCWWHNSQMKFPLTIKTVKQSIVCICGHNII